MDRLLRRGIRLRRAILEYSITKEESFFSDTGAEERGCEIQSSEGSDSGDPMSIVPHHALIQLKIIECSYRMAALLLDGNRIAHY